MKKYRTTLKIILTQIGNMKTIRITVESNGKVSPTRDYAYDKKDNIAWYDEVLELIDINDEQ
jgi:hypothetical protein